MRRQAAKPYRPLSPWWERAVLLWIACGLAVGIVAVVFDGRWNL